MLSIIKIDDIEYLFDKKISSFTIFQFCYNKNINIPCFCYHEKLTIAGNCRMCIVQINNNLGASCAINVAENMIIYTNNKRVREARESVLEFLLINHPLDCPICDQGGECDLQDISLTFGSDRGRFYEDKKRSVDNFSQNGPLIKTVMTRCIHCTRCVRFANEVSNFPLGVFDRGSNMEIGTYSNINLLNELSGNIIDLCPVGALTSMPYAFKQRPWESNFYSNIDFLDSLASTIRVYIYSNKIVRVLPLLNESLNEEWISNKTRFSYDSLIINRINYPKFKLYSKFIVISWDFAILLFYYILKKNILNNNNIVSSVGFFTDLQTSLALKTFFNSLGSSNILYNLKKINWIFDFKTLYFLNNLIEELEFINFYLFISCNLRLEAPVLNIRIKKNYNLNKSNELFLFSYGLSLNFSTYPVKNLGNKILSFIKFLEGKQKFSCDFFFKNFFTFKYLNVLYSIYKNTSFFLGNSIIYRNDARFFLDALLNIYNKNYISFKLNLINTYLGFYSYSSIVLDSYNNKAKKNIGLYYLISNEITESIEDTKFLIYQGFIKSVSYFNSTLVLPTTAPYEFNSLYINLEGKYRHIKQVVKSFVGTYNDWDIFSLLNICNKKKQVLKIYLFICFYKINKYFIDLINYYCNFFLSISNFLIELFYNTGYVNQKDIIKLKNLYISFYLKINKVYNTLFNSFVNNYYLSDFYTKNSRVMSSSSFKQYLIFKI